MVLTTYIITTPVIIINLINNKKLLFIKKIETIPMIIINLINNKKLLFIKKIE